MSISANFTAQYYVQQTLCCRMMPHSLPVRLSLLHCQTNKHIIKIPELSTSVIILVLSKLN